MEVKHEPEAGIVITNLILQTIYDHLYTMECTYKVTFALFRDITVTGTNMPSMAKFPG